MAIQFFGFQSPRCRSCCMQRMERLAELHACSSATYEHAFARSLPCVIVDQLPGRVMPSRHAAMVPHQLCGPRCFLSLAPCKLRFLQLGLLRTTPRVWIARAPPSTKERPPSCSCPVVHEGGSQVPPLLKNKKNKMLPCRATTYTCCNY